MDDLPPMLFVTDLAPLLGLGESAVRKMIRRGELGSFLRLGRRLCLRREAFVEALTELERRAALDVRTSGLGKPDPEIMALVRGEGASRARASRQARTRSSKRA